MSLNTCVYWKCIIGKPGREKVLALQKPVRILKKIRIVIPDKC